MRHAPKIVLGTLILLALSACAAGSTDSHVAAAGGFFPQLLLGFWHGLIAPITLIVEIINQFWPHALPWNAHLYESSGTGFGYDIGFYLGLASSPSVLASRMRGRNH